MSYDDCVIIHVQFRLFTLGSSFTSLQMVHWLHRRGQQLLLAKVKNAEWQDWYI